MLASTPRQVWAPAGTFHLLVLDNERVVRGPKLKLQQGAGETHFGMMKVKSCSETSVRGSFPLRSLRALLMSRADQSLAHLIGRPSNLAFTCFTITLVVELGDVFETAASCNEAAIAGRTPADLLKIG